MRGQAIRGTCRAVVAAACLALLLPASCARPGNTPEVPSPDVLLTPADRVLILAPHPDDEVLGCAGVIQKALAAKLPLHVVFLTYGDNNQWSFLVYRKRPVVAPGEALQMGRVRHDEAIDAARVLGVPPDRLTFLGYPDFRTLAIWCSHWGDAGAAESMLTQTRAVPYQSAFRPGAPYKGEEVVRDLETILREFKPTKVFVSHPGDENPDHMALYLFTRVALWDLDETPPPAVFPYLVHHRKWPTPRGFHPDVKLVPPKVFQDRIAWRSCDLTPEEVDRKQAALRKHRSQHDAGSQYLLSFVRPNELFGDFPVVTLKKGAPPVTQSLDREESEEIPEELVDEERLSFVGLMERSIRREDEHLVLTITLSRPVGQTVGVSAYVFGYRKDCPFARMPKLHVKCGSVNQVLLDQDRRLPADAVTVTRTSRQMEIRIPLDVLGRPERILTSARTYMSAVPLDSASWRTLEIPD